MQAGKLRNLIQIQARDSGQDGAGQPLITWTTAFTVWARVVSVTGNENFKAMQFSPEVTHQVTIRYLDGITPLHRIITAEGRTLDILTVNYGERKMDAVILTCKERVSWDSGN